MPPGVWRVLADCRRAPDRTMLPVRDGVGPSCVALPAGPWPTFLDFLSERLPAVSRREWQERMLSGEVVDTQGRPVPPDRRYRTQGKLYYYRVLPPEPRRAADEAVLFEDEWLVVADKPHFLPVTPAGKHLQETLLVRLRRRLGLDALSPLHRIDRETAGLVLFAKQATTRGAYQTLFAARAVCKTYEAIAPLRHTLDFPLNYASHLVDDDNFMRMREEPAPRSGAGTPNAHTRIEVLQRAGHLARFRLHPSTGKRHQLRVHMAALGMPILGDRIYPVLMPENTDDRTNPLRLLASEIAFRDPFTGQQRHFASRQQLQFPPG